MVPDRRGCDGPSRRTLLATLSSASIASIAGCTVLNDDSGSADSAGDGSVTATAADGGEPPTIEVVDEAPIDRPIEIAVDGLAAGSTARVVAETTDPASGEEWRSAATFEATDDGRIDLDEQAPIEGDYEGVDGMGLIWAMTTDASERRATFGWQNYDVDLSVALADADDPVAETTSRVYPDVPTDGFGDGVVGTVHLPPGDGEAPAVLLLHGSGGQPLGRQAQFLADRGFVAGAIQYFGSPDPIPGNLAAVPLEYVETAIERLLEHDRVAGDAVGVYGMSKGAELGFLAASHLDRIDAVTSVSGSGVVWQGLTADFRPVDTSSWSIDGEAVPYVEMGQIRAETSRERYEYGLVTANEETVAAATIPLERTDATVLAVSGGSDDLWNAVSLTERALDRLDEAAYEHVVYEDAGHRIVPPYRPTYGSSLSRGLTYGGTPAANAVASADHWPQVIAFFEDQLGE